MNQKISEVESIKDKLGDGQISEAQTQLNKLYEGMTDTDRVDPGVMMALHELTQIEELEIPDPEISTGFSIDNNLHIETQPNLEVEERILGMLPDIPEQLKNFGGQNIYSKENMVEINNFYKDKNTVIVDIDGVIRIDYRTTGNKMFPEALDSIYELIERGYNIVFWTARERESANEVLDIFFDSEAYKKKFMLISQENYLFSKNEVGNMEEFGSVMELSPNVDEQTKRYTIKKDWLWSNPTSRGREQNFDQNKLFELMFPPGTTLLDDQIYTRLHTSVFGEKFFETYSKSSNPVIKIGSMDYSPVYLKHGYDTNYQPEGGQMKVQDLKNLLEIGNKDTFDPYFVIDYYEEIDDNLSPIERLKLALKVYTDRTSLTLGFVENHFPDLLDRS